MIDLPNHLRPHTSQPDGRYMRQHPTTAPHCKECGCRYTAASTREMVTYYKPRCECAPRELVARLRPQKHT